MSALAISLRRRPRLTKPKQSRARSRSPYNESSQVASMASSSCRVMTVFLVGRSPRLTDERWARLSSVRTLGSSHGLASCLSLCAVDSTAMRWVTELATQHDELRSAQQAAEHRRSPSGGTRRSVGSGISPVATLSRTIQTQVDEIGGGRQGRTWETLPEGCSHEIRKRSAKRKSPGRAGGF